MKARLFAPVLALAVVGSTAPAFASPIQPQPRIQDYHPGQGGGWDQPPGEFREVQRQGFHDGIDAARHDAHEGRRPDPAQHREFREPMVPQPDRHDYREAFRRGYFMAMHHMHDNNDGGGPR